MQQRFRTHQIVRVGDQANAGCSGLRSHREEKG
jgi:hypothetical protein